MFNWKLRLGNIQIDNKIKNNSQMNIAESADRFDFPLTDVAYLIIIKMKQFQQKP